MESCFASTWSSSDDIGLELSWVMGSGIWDMVIWLAVASSVRLPFVTRDKYVSRRSCNCSVFVSNGGTSSNRRSSANKFFLLARCRCCRSFSFSRRSSASSMRSCADSISSSQRSCVHPSGVSLKNSDRTLITAPFSSSVNARTFLLSNAISNDNGFSVS